MSEHASCQPESTDRWRAATGLIVVLAAGVGMAAWTWPFCPEALNDFGREAYAPWRISAARGVLYRDLNSFNGPLSPYFNAALFQLFGGPSLRLLKAANAVIALSGASLVYFMVRQIAGALAATSGGVAVVTIFMFAHLGGGNFNFLTPYSHELTHGVVLSLAMILCLSRAAGGKRGRLGWTAGSGFILGLVLLTKAEVALASGAAAVVALVLMALSDGRGARPPVVATLCVALVFIAAAVAPPLAALVLLSRAMPMESALRGIAGAWLWIGDSRVGSLPFFRRVMGTDEVRVNLGRMFNWFAVYAALIAAATIVGMVLRRTEGTHAPRSSRAWIASTVTALATAAPLVWWWRRLPWRDLFRALPVFLGILFVWQAARAWTGMRSRRVSERDVLALVFCAFALVLLGKIALNVRAFHYGFALAMPGTVLLIAALVSSAPRQIAAHGGSGVVLRTFALTALAVTVVVHIRTTAAWLAERRYAVGEGADRFWADSTGAVMDQARRRIQELSRPGDTLVAMPEGAMLNYLLRMPSTSRYVNFLPSEMRMYGEETMLDELSRRPPAFVAIVHRPAPEYGAATFGEEYARAIAGWVGQAYVPVALEGAMPFAGNDFGVLILRRRDTAGPSRAPGTNPAGGHFGPKNAYFHRAAAR